jgi:hypothetical protein
MDQDDIELPFPDATEDTTDAETVKELIEECKDKVKSYALKYWAQAQYNERMGVGEQEQILDASWGLGPDPSWTEATPFNCRNYLRNLRLTWSSRILEDRPSIKCYPSEPGADLAKAMKSDQILDYVRQNQDWDDLCFSAANMVQDHSLIGIKTVWDPLYGPASQGIPEYDDAGMPVIGEDGLQARTRVGEPLGDVHWQLLSIFDFGTDGSENIEDSKWVYFTTHIDKYDAVQLLKSAGIDEAPEEVKYKDTWGVERTGVEITELWWKPDYRFPKGLYCVTVGDYAVQAIDFPYKHKELPIAIWKCGPRRNSPYGSTHMDDAVYIQRTINETVAAMSRQARQIRDMKLIAPTAIIGAIEDGNHMIPCDDVALMNAARYLEPPDMAKVLISQLEDNTKALFAIFGLNEMLTGAENIKSGTAAKSIAYLNKLDSMKLAGAARSLSKCILRVMRQTLKLYQQYAIVPRIAHITGDQNLVSSFEWTKADISGVDVRMEPITGFANMRATQVQNANDQMAQTGPTPDLMSQSKTGLQQTAFDKSQREVVQAEIQAILQGQQPEPDTTIDANIASDEIMGVLSQYRGTAFEGPLKQLLMTYMQAMSKQQTYNAAMSAAEGNAPNGQQPL